LESGTFSINVPSIDYVVETDYCGLVMDIAYFGEVIQVFVDEVGKGWASGKEYKA